jgi:hypothetical protein
LQRSLFPEIQELTPGILPSAFGHTWCVQIRSCRICATTLSLLAMTAFLYIIPRVLGAIASCWHYGQPARHQQIPVSPVMNTVNNLQTLSNPVVFT